MKVKKLIRILQRMPEDQRVFILYDGIPRMPANIVYESEKGPVVITNHDELCVDKTAEPKDQSLIVQVTKRIKAIIPGKRSREDDWDNL
jgi:hypothetical protein